MRKNYLKEIISFLTVVLFLLPLAVWGDSSYPFIGIKAVWLQTYGLLVFFLYLILVLYHFQKYRPRFSWLGLAVLVFFVAIFISSIHGVDFRRSFWDRYERLTGLFVMLHYGVLFLVWRSVFHKEEWYKLWRWFAGMGAGVLLAAFIQILKPNFLLNLGAARVSSTLGNPIYVAGFCLFTFFSGLVFWFKTKNRYKWLWLAEACLSVIVLAATESRGGALGLWAGLAFAAAALLADKETRSRHRKKIYALAAVLVLAPLLYFAFAQLPGSGALPVIGRYFTGDQSRLTFWKMAVDAWKEKKWLGWGWENFFDAANKYYDPALYKFSPEWPDNAHNVLFNNLATTGIVGSAAYLAVFFFLYRALFKKLKQRDAGERLTFILVGAFFAAHFVQNLFIFENLSSWLVFFWMLAGVDLLAAGAAPKNVAAENAASLRQKILNNKFVRYAGRFMRPVAVFAAAFGAFLVFYRYTYIPAKADYINTQAVKQAAVDFKSAMDTHRQAIKIAVNPYRPQIADDFGEFILTWLHVHPDFPFSQYRALSQDMYVFGVNALRSYLSDYPRDVHAQYVLALAYQDGYVFWQNPGYLTAAEQEYGTMLSFNPRRQDLLYGLARVKVSQSQDAEALKIIQKAIAEAPGVADSYWMAGSVYYDMKDGENAYLNFKKSLEMGYSPDKKQLSGVLDLFKANKNAAAIESLLK